jgi:hypothetical protein
VVDVVELLADTVVDEVDEDEVVDSRVLDVVLKEGMDEDVTGSQVLEELEGIDVGRKVDEVEDVESPDTKVTVLNSEEPRTAEPK